VTGVLGFAKILLMSLSRIMIRIVKNVPRFLWIIIKAFAYGVYYLLTALACALCVGILLAMGPIGWIILGYWYINYAVEKKVDQTLHSQKSPPQA
jgi:hypothetical protein